MKVVTAAEMREIDRRTISEFGLPGEVLMNTAGKFVADFVLSEYSSSPVNIICGTGNNGGDGFAAAYYLHNRGLDIRIILCGTMDNVSPSSRIYMNLCGRCGIPVTEITGSSTVSEINFLPGIIIDAVFGTGFRGRPDDFHRDIFNRVNSSGLDVLSVDIPSGLPSEGIIESDVIVKSDITITIGLPKINIAVYPGKGYCGRTIIADIGFPVSLTSSDEIQTALIDRSLFEDIPFFSTDYDLHKGERGHTLLAGGFDGMEGAILLTAASLFKTGAGLATLATTPASRSIIAGRIPELMTAAIPEDNHNQWFNKLISSRKFTSLIIGPGLGRSAFAESVFISAIESAAENGISRILIDGDGLFHLAVYLKKRSLPDGPAYCITPHFMEASRITGHDIDTIKNDRFRFCVETAQKTGCTVVLKGPATIVSDGTLTYINTSGNSLLATAGSGDVLSGIIGSFMCGAGDITSAACAGVHIHGLCADIHKKKISAFSMTAGEIIQHITSALADTFQHRDK